MVWFLWACQDADSVKNVEQSDTGQAAQDSAVNLYRYSIVMIFSQ